MAVSALHAWLSISVRADQIISGTVINITALGLTGYLNRLLKPTDSAGSFAPFVPPQALVDLPVVGWLFRMFLQVDLSLPFYASATNGYPAVFSTSLGLSFR